mgnify:FL=1
MTTVYLVDDHAIARAGTRALLADFDVVGEAATTEKAIQGILETRPDVALVDVHLETRRAGAEIVRAVKEVDPTILCVAFSVSQSRRDVAALFAAGVDGYLTKQASAQELATALEEALGGGKPVSPDVAQFMIELDDIMVQMSLLGTLTPREREVVDCIAKGYTYRQTSTKLGMKVKTLETHMAHIFEKLGVATRAELSFLWWDIDPEDHQRAD